MKAWVKRASGLRLEDVPEPVAGSDEVLVQVKAASLNRGEVRMAKNAADGVIPGWDVAGITADGRRVVGLVRSGAWAEVVRVPAAHVATVPEDISLDVASTLPVAALTALRAFDVAGFVTGKRVLITGASGGVGQFALQLGLAAGAQVTAISTRTLDAGPFTHVQTIQQAEGLYDFVLESVGGSSLSTALEKIAPGGVVVTMGNSSEQDTTFSARTLFGKSGARLHGLLIFEEMESRCVTSRDFDRIFTLLRAGTLRAPIEVRRSFTELPAVLAELEHRAYTGKAVLTLP